jgi:hypothetical protein
VATVPAATTRPTGQSAAFAGPIVTGCPTTPDMGIGCTTAPPDRCLDASGQSRMVHRSSAASLHRIMLGMATPAVAAELEGARVVDFPLRGEWRAVHTPASRIPSHGTDILGQRYAFDLMRLDPGTSRYHPSSGLRTLLFGVPTHECHGWGEPIHAPLDGEVVAARDGLAERVRIHPVRDLALVLMNGLTFRPT